MEYNETEYCDILVKIGLNVAYYRKYRKITQEELSELVGVTRTAIGHIEASEMDYGMRIKTLFKIAKALDVPLKTFLIFGIDFSRVRRNILLNIKFLKRG